MRNAIISFLVAAATALLFLQSHDSLKYQPDRREENIETSTLAHRQEIWLAVLEWCESRGFPDALNPIDKDGTPSFGAFQFKPDTFARYSKKYGIDGKLKDYNTQRAIVQRMIGDPEVIWEQEFPDCVRRYGRPPQK